MLVPGVMSRDVLIVDDDSLVRESLSEVLADLGWAVRCAGGGIEALDLHRRDPCLLLVSDVEMPDISGFELFRRLRDGERAPACVLMSARADEDMHRAAERAGVMRLFRKPVTIARFTATVRDLIPSPRDGGPPPASRN